MGIESKPGFDAFTWELERSTIFDWMRKNEIETLDCSFNGSGDSGSFDNYVGISLKSSVCNEDQKARRQRYESLYEEIRTKIVMHGLTLQELVLERSAEIENHTNHGVDWWNNDGGKGNVQWILDGEADSGDYYKEGISLSISKRIIELDTSYFSITGNVNNDEPSV